MKMGWVRAGLMMAAVAGMATGIPATADDYTPPKIYTVTPTGVNLSDGSYTFSDTDLSIGPLTLERFYISGKRDPNTKFFGPRITSNFDIYVAKNVRAPINPFVLPRRYAPIVHIGSSSVGVYAQSADAANQPIYFGNVDSQSGQLSQASGVYTFIAQDGTIYTFGGPGAAGMANSQRVTSIAFPDGRTQSFSYNGSGQLKMVADSSGYALVFDYDGSGLTSAACAFNLSQTYVTATATCTGAALKTSYAYTGGLLTSVTDVAGQVTTYTYPTNQLCIKPPGYSVCKVSTTFQSTKPWIVSQQTLADGSVWNFSITGDSENARSPEPSYVEDPTNGGTVTDPNGKVSYYGFSKTSPYTMTDSNGRTTKYRYTGGYENEWSLYTNNPPDRAEGSLLTEADFPDGSKYLAQYTGLNVVYKQTWVAKPLSGLADRVVEYGYPSCPSGFGPTCAKPISKKDPKGNQTDYAYTSFGATQSEMLPAPTAGGARPLKLYTYVQKYAYVMNSGGTLVQATAQIWVPDTVTECQTVAGSSPAAACDPSAAQRVTAYQYGADGTANNLLMRAMVVTANIGSTPTSYRTCFSYDARGRKISTTTPRGTNTGACS